MGQNQRRLAYHWSAIFFALKKNLVIFSSCFPVAADATVGF